MSSRVKPDSIQPKVHGAAPPDLLRIRPIGIDDWANVRYVHANAFRSIIAPHVELRSAQAFLASVDQPAYVDRLIASDLIGAWLDNELVGTAGWRPASDRAGMARIEGLFVRPLFTFMGIGSALLDLAEGRAREAGFAAFTVTAPSVSVPFLLRFGYDIAAHGADLPDAPFDEPMFLMRKRAADVGEECADDADADGMVRRPRALLIGH